MNRPHSPALFVVFAALTALLLWPLREFARLAPAAVLHVFLALGVLPLILAAQIHFIPVLTRSRSASPGIQAVPWLALAGGGLLVGSLAGGRHPVVLYNLAALLALAAALLLFLWSRQRARRSLGAPHPGLVWYQASQLMLMLALLAILAINLWPSDFAGLRRLHLHLNLLGFVGLTAIGTLQVLLPTVLQKPDPQAADRLRAGLPGVLAGILLSAVGAAVYWPLAIPGAVILLFGLAQLGLAWRRTFGRALWTLHGAAPLLLAAWAGAVLLVATGPLHAVGLLANAVAPQAFVVAVLLPLISGAASHLWPLWWPSGGAAAGLQCRLGRWGGAAGLRLSDCRRSRSARSRLGAGARLPSRSGPQRTAGDQPVLPRAVEPDRL